MFELVLGREAWVQRRLDEGHHIYEAQMIADDGRRFACAALRDAVLTLRVVQVADKQIVVV